MPLPVSLLYAACLLALPILAIFVLSRRPASRLHRLFFWGALALFGWLLTLFVFDGARDPQRLLALGRLNFAFSQAAVLFGYLFVARLSARPGRRTALLVLETLALAAVTLATPLIDRRELVLGGVHVTRFGPLFPWHAAHMLLYPAATASTAFRAARAASRRLRSQLEWVGAGILATASIAIVCDLALPYLFHIFTLQDVGALSTVLFLGAVAYAISVHRLFDVRIVVRRTVVLSLLFAIVHAFYSGAFLVLSDSAPPGAEAYRFELEFVNVLIIAVAFKSLDRFLEDRVGGWLFPRDRAARSLMAGLPSELAGVTTLGPSLHVILQAVERVFHPYFSALFVLEPGEGGAPRVRRLEHTGRATAPRLLPLIQAPLLDYIRITAEPLRTDVLLRELGSGEAANPGTATSRHGSQAEVVGRIAQDLASRRVALVVPILSGERVAGLLVLGERPSGRSYRKRDVGALRPAVAQAAFVIERARFAEGR